MDNLINLLPPNQKEKVLFEKRAKIFLTISIIPFIFLFLLTVTIFSINYQLNLILANKNNQIDLELEQFSYVLESQQKISSHNKLVSNLELFYKENKSPIFIFEKLENSLPDGVYLNILKIKNSGLGFEVSFSGQAASWDLLFDTEKNLEDNFEEVVFTPESWTKLENINFDSKLMIKNSNE